jgi:hypothetical protein
MTRWTEWAQAIRRTPAVPPGIEMGDGRRMGAEDVLEGHYRRLAARTRNQPRAVQVQVGENLVTAIAVLAPDLAPLTEIAEEVADALPPVQPAPQFREHLHQALELTHKQHAAQRVLGTRPQPAPARVQAPVWVAGVLLALIAIVLIGRWQVRRATREASVS